MNNLLQSIEQSVQHSVEQKNLLPFSIYSAYKEQILLNVPIAKPLLILVIEGEKVLGKNNEFVCREGEFIFLANNPALNMRNIPKDKNYIALLIEFDDQDFEGSQFRNLKNNTFSNNNNECVIGQSTALLNTCLQQFVEISLSLPDALWSLRKREIIELLCHMGYEDILSLLNRHQIKEKLHSIFTSEGGWAITVNEICNKLAMSESTLRRKLKSEGTSVQEIKDLARLGVGLHLLQTTNNSISFVAEQSGYQSQSRFTERFKNKFGLTPSALRKTKMTD